VDEHDTLEHKTRQEHVSEVHEGEGEVPVQTRGGGEVRAYRQQRWCEMAAFLASSLAALGLGEKREIERGCEGFL
jgi:hypothetical protein